MGGLLFKTERLKAKDYHFFEKYISEKLKKKNICFKIPRYFSNKEDFGDMDVLVKSLYPSYEEWRTTYPKEEALKQIKEFFQKLN